MKLLNFRLISPFIRENRLSTMVNKCEPSLLNPAFSFGVFRHLCVNLNKFGAAPHVVNLYISTKNECSTVITICFRSPKEVVLINVLWLIHWHKQTHARIYRHKVMCAWKRKVRNQQHKYNIARHDIWFVNQVLSTKSSRCLNLSLCAVIKAGWLNVFNVFTNNYRNNYLVYLEKRSPLHLW